MFELPMFSWSLHKQQVNRRKIYGVDNGLIRTNSFSFSENLGNRLENIVFTELKRDRSELYYHRNKYECDFIRKQGSEITGIFQVTTRLEESNRIREVNGVIEAAKEYGLSEGMILTKEGKEQHEIDGIHLNVVPVNEWLLTKETKS
jgi:hypothetical protein